MKKVKIISMLTAIISIISMMGGIYVVCYYVDNLVVRGLSIFILILSSVLASNTVRLIFEEGR